MRYAIIALTAGAVKFGETLKYQLKEADLYVLPKFSGEGHKFIEGSLMDFTGTLFDKHRVIIFIMATGIVVRAIAEHLKNKTVDPAVIVMDEKGRFVISLLSGHIGGANSEAEKIASLTGAVPVITTASDLNNKLAVDQLALKYNCSMDDMKRATEITAMIVNGRPVRLESDFSGVQPPEYLICPEGKEDGIIRVSCEKLVIKDRPVVQLSPRLIIAGMGCRKGTPSEKLIHFLQDTFIHLNLDMRSLKALASISIKAEDLKEPSKILNVPLLLFEPEEIKKVEHLFEGSSFVREVTGVSSVCEPAAYLGSDKTGKMILNKKKKEGMTLALWLEDIKESS